MAHNIKNGGYKMKKLISLLLAVSMILSIGVVFSFADDGSSTESVALSYVGEHSPGIWLNQFDGDGNCKGYALTIFNAAAPFTAIVFPTLYAGKSENSEDVEDRFELYTFTGEKEKSLAADPIFTIDLPVDGDQNDFTVAFGEQCPQASTSSRSLSLPPIPTA